MQSNINRYYTTTEEHADKLPAKEWDELANENVYMTHGWLRTLERTLIESPRPLYVLVCDSGRLLGCAVCYAQKKEDRLLGIDDPLLGRFKHVFPRLGMSFRPALVSPLRFAARCPILIRQDLSSKDRAQVLDRLLIEIEKHAVSHKLSTAFSTTSEDCEINTALQDRGYIQAMDIPIAYLDITWKDFSGYLSYLRKMSRNEAKSVKRQINKNRRAGVSIKNVHSLGGPDNTLMHLFRLNHFKYERGPFKYKDSLLRELKSNLGEHTVIKMASKNSQPIGASVTLTKGDVNSQMLIGIDHALSRDDLTYFNLNIYEEIKGAISSGSKRIYFGQGAYYLKIRRGCKVIDTYTYFKPVGLRHHIMTRLWFPILSAWVKAKLPDWIHRNHEAGCK
jgi:predicted N-acyltransferase